MITPAGVVGALVSPRKVVSVWRSALLPEFGVLRGRRPSEACRKQLLLVNTVLYVHG